MYPEAYIIGRDGRIVRKVVGPQNWTGPEMTSIFDPGCWKPSNSLS